VINLSFILVALSAALANDIAINGNFEKGLEGWEAGVTPPKTALVESVDGRPVARITAPADAQIGYPGFRQQYAVAPGTLVSATVDARAVGIRDGYGVYIALEFYDEKGQRISVSQSGAAPPDVSWRKLAVRSIAPPAAAKAQLCLILNGHGEGNFSGVSVSATPGAVPALPDGPVTLTVTGEKVCPSLRGFGAEDDGWFYNAGNAAHGVSQEDCTLREARIRWMNPAWVRMFCWYKDWNPSGDWETFDFDSDNMRSHYRALDLYQSLGTTVNIVGVEWGLPKFDDLEKTARAIGALFEHLVREKGYTCVREWTLSNEPNTTWVQRGNSFEEFVRMHELVKAEFARRSLPVRILGSDDTSGLSWFEDCVRSDRYFASADYFASHLYTPFSDCGLAPFFFDDRLAILRTRNPEKQLVIAEFGFQDARSGTLVNPIMETYPYALWTSAFVIQGLNKGLAGYSIWCLHEMYYPGNGFMNYGLWNYKDRDWGVRPVYFAWANFSRFTKAGDAVYRCESSAPGHVLAARVGKILFWVNEADRPVPVRVTGMAPSSVHAYEETTLTGDRECGTTLNAVDGLWTLPPASFGRMEE